MILNCSYEPLPHDLAKTAFSKLRSTVNPVLDEDLQMLYNDFVQACIDYAKMRAEWSLMTAQQRADRDQSRTMLHDHVITTSTILRRYMRQIGLSDEWYFFPDDADINAQPYRKILGDFACYITQILGIEAR